MNVVVRENAKVHEEVMITRYILTILMPMLVMAERDAIPDVA